MAGADRLNPGEGGAVFEVEFPRHVVPGHGARNANVP